jgi:photosystem II stability/assembly factor-like uncharacterized protein
MPRELKIGLSIVAVGMVLIFVLPLSFGMRDTDKKYVGRSMIEMREVLERGKSSNLIYSDDAGASWGLIEYSTKAVQFPTTITDMAFHPFTRRIIYLGSSDAGLWVSEDYGSIWRHISSAAGSVLGASDPIQHIVISEENPQVLFATSVKNGYGMVIRSNDAGATFQEIFRTPAQGIEITGLAIYPRDSNRIVFATSQGGVFRSGDGGISWNVLRWFDQGVRELLINPELSQQMYAVLADGGLFRTNDGGITWEDQGSGFRRVVVSSRTRISLFGSASDRNVPMVPTDPQSFDILYAAGANGIFRSDNSGVEWDRLNTLIPQAGIPRFRGVAISPMDAQHVVAFTPADMHQSKNLGREWQVRRVVGGGLLLTQLWLHPRDENLWFATTQITE